ncbi:hyaluronidase-like [Tiliqua scincoides]|uniref:hyaluronidase-like n=1 Tax=Tiliqua scincoides TaxID=71010 RepID=UPI0034634A06
MWQLWIKYIAIMAFMVGGDILKPAKNPMIPGNPFMVFWNAPTEPCWRRYKVDLELATFGIVPNPNETLSGSVVTIFYHNRMGLYPYVEHGSIFHGGIPQSQDLDQHLAKVESDIDKAIPKKMFNGLGVIDWENWRPLWVRNWGDKTVYRNLSMDLVRGRNPTWDDKKIMATATAEFESAGRNFMDRTLFHLKKIRPYGLWGFYLFPDCYNHDYKAKPTTYTGNCPTVDVGRNDLLHWLWKQSSALFPSIYLLDALKSSPHAVKFVRHRVMEAMRVAKQSGGDYDTPVYVYSMPVYVHTNDTMTEGDLVNTIGETASLGAAGIILWGSSIFGRSRDVCVLLSNYIGGLFGHYLVNVTTATKICSEHICSNHGKCLRKNSTSSAYLHLPSQSFSIQVKVSHLGKKVSVKGKLSDQEMEQWREDFMCQCFPANLLKCVWDMDNDSFCSPIFRMSNSFKDRIKNTF